MIYDASLDELLQKVWDGKRIDAAEALRLYHLPLEELGTLADRRRQLAKAPAFDGRGNEIVTYIVDRNVNYTNVCNVYCKFCAFYRVEKDDDAYVITHDEIDKKIAETIALGGTQILMQGGHHSKLSIQWYLDLLSHIKTKFPQINIHGFSPSEFVHFQEVFQKPVEEIIREFVKAGLGSIPGGGGEILVDRVRQRIAPLKAMSDEWLNVMDVAHRLGLASTATMMFGHVETVVERIEHLERVRAQQDKSLNYEKSPLTRSSTTLSPFDGERDGVRGFTAFIAWTFQAEHTKLKAPTVGAHEYLRMQALSRIYLDNIPNIQSSWVTQGQEIGQIALKYGANDLGSIMIEENVVSQAGTTFRMGVTDMQRLIKDLGYEPHQRDNWYRLVN
ncbi:MAG: cyclic dehypoxanthinyl futalosine synthase [Verrucomicrobiota bacterium]